MSEIPKVNKVWHPAGLPSLQRRSNMSRYRIPILVWCILLLNVPALGLSATYEVQRGDSLWEIARRFRTSVARIKKINGLKSPRIYPGQQLQVGEKIREFLLPNGPYYHTRPARDLQDTRDYAEGSSGTPARDFARARGLLASHRSELEVRFARIKGRKKPLRGWRIVIDPGHGGRDPGAIVSNRDGRDRGVHVVEDEYVYDIALRVFERLLLYGASVDLTVISPNHLRRDNTPASSTFVNEQNEVYNDPAMSRSSKNGSRPGSDNINRRVRISNAFFGGRSKTLFVSLHADNSPGRPKGPLVIYQKKGRRVDRASKKLAESLRRALDSPTVPAQMGGRNLAVLRGNRARAEVLVEIRNVAFVGDAWALRFHETREEDADRVVKGILDYVGE